MNLHPAHDLADSSAPLASEDWTMSTGVEANDGTLYYFADLYQEGYLVCRVGYVGPRVDVAESQLALAKRARAWIAEYLLRRRDE